MSLETLGNRSPRSREGERMTTTETAPKIRARTGKQFLDEPRPATSASSG